MTIDFSPLLAWPYLAALTLVAAVLAALGIWRGVRGAWIRAAALQHSASHLQIPSSSRRNANPSPPLSPSSSTAARPGER